LRAGLVRDQRHAENLLCVEFGVFARAGHFDAAALAAATGVNLRLDDHARCALGKELAGNRRGLFQRVGHFAARHGDAISCQDFFRLVLVNFHPEFPSCLSAANQYTPFGSAGKTSARPLRREI
jgi:hypothetical protein